MARETPPGSRPPRSRASMSRPIGPEQRGEREVRLPAGADDTCREQVCGAVRL